NDTLRLRRVVGSCERRQPGRDLCWDGRRGPHVHVGRRTVRNTANNTEPNTECYADSLPWVHLDPHCDRNCHHIALADTTLNGFSDISDVSGLTSVFGQGVPPAPARYNIAPDPPDGFVDITDVSRMTGLFGQSCNA